MIFDKQNTRENCHLFFFYFLFYFFFVVFGYSIKQWFFDCNYVWCNHLFIPFSFVLMQQVLSVVVFFCLFKPAMINFYLNFDFTKQFDLLFKIQHYSLLNWNSFFFNSSSSSTTTIMEITRIFFLFFFWIKNHEYGIKIGKSKTMITTRNNEEHINKIKHEHKNNLFISKITTKKKLY